MNSKSKELIENHFSQTKDLEKLFSVITKASEKWDQMKIFVESHKDKIFNILSLQNLIVFWNMSRDLDEEIGEITRNYGSELLELFDRENIQTNLVFVQQKLEEKRNNLINEIPLDKISTVENLLSTLKTKSVAEVSESGSERVLKVSWETELDDFIYDIVEASSQKYTQSSASRLRNLLTKHDLSTVKEFMNFLDNKHPRSDPKKSFLHNFFALRNAWKKSGQILWEVMRDKIFETYTKEDAQNINGLLTGHLSLSFRA